MFFIILGLVPRFEEYMYFYQIDILEFTNQNYANLQIVSVSGVLIGSLAFKWTSKLVGLRAMLVFACIINIVGSVGKIFFVRGVTFGMDPFLYYSIINLFSESVKFACETMTALTLLAKIIPPKIEASMFSLLGGVLNLSYWVLARLLGNIFNLFFGVSEDNLDELWKLFLIQAITALGPVFFIWLLPNPQEVAAI